MPLDDRSVNLTSAPGTETAFRELDISTLPPPAPWLDELAAFYDQATQRSATLLGYPESQVFATHPLVAQFGQLAMNNLGEPAETDGPMRYATNSAAFERWVLDWFARLYDLPSSESWGYLTGSGSEGNLWGLLLGREACGGVAAAPVLYHSDAAHYSVHKAALVLGIEERSVPHLRSGELDYGSLAEAMHANRGRPAVILATAGTLSVRLA